MWLVIQSINQFIQSQAEVRHLRKMAAMDQQIIAAQRRTIEEQEQHIDEAEREWRVIMGHLKSKIAKLESA